MFHFTYLQAIVIGLLQGLTELFPVSSLGHAVIFPAWLGGTWAIFAKDPQYLLIAIAFHFASALALLVVFGERWIRILTSSFNSLRRRPDNGPGITLLLLLIVGSLPVAILGLIFNDTFQENFGKPVLAGVFLMINGLILFSVEKLTSRRNSHVTHAEPDAAIVERVTLGQSLIVGMGQSLALFAGISRFGITMSFGMLRGLSRSVAADFAFLLAFPVIFGASLLKLPKLQHGAITAWGPLSVGMLVSFIATYFAITFLVKYFKSNSLRPFAYYCLFVGVASIIRFGFFA